MKYTQTFAEAYRQVKLKQALSEDHEVSMAISQLKTIQDNLNQAMAILQTKGADYDMEAWVQSKITSANDKMTSVADYMKNTPSVDEAVVDKRFKNDERDGD
jgi:protein subunit release factor A